MKKLNKVICLFDVDGTLTKPRNVIMTLIQEIQTDMLLCLDKLKSVVDIAYVGGSDFNKMKQQLTQEGIAKAIYTFSENGLLAFKGSEVIGKQVSKLLQRTSVAILGNKNFRTSSISVSNIFRTLSCLSKEAHLSNSGQECSIFHQ